MKLWISDGHDGWETEALTPTKAIDKAIADGDYTPPDGEWSYEREFEVSSIDEHGDIGAALLRRRVVFHPDEPMCADGHGHHVWGFRHGSWAISIDRCVYCGRIRERDYARLNGEGREMDKIAYCYPPKED